MKITRLEPFILHVPVTGSQIADSTNRITHWGGVGAIIETDAGIRGYGYTGTLGHLPGDRLIRDCIATCYGPLLQGEDPRHVRQLWHKLANFPPLRWIGRAGVTQMALAAVDVALWDIKAKAADMPLWKLLGGSDTTRIEAYNTDCGWLNWSKQQLIDDALRLVEEGYRGVKLKIGSPDPGDDVDRIAAVREAIGPGIKLMVDANTRWDLPTATRVGRRFAEHDVYWFEEPLHCDDVPGHAALARAIETPIALGESLYSVDAFRNFILAGGVHYVQPDATRLGGITPCWQVAELAAAHRLSVNTHAADMVQIHQHLAIAHPGHGVLEYIPWARHCFEEPVTVEEGFYKVPQIPGAGTTLKPEALEKFAVQ